jgi:acyl transferase domain-containing protein/SAM-dependent methyltransferase
MDEMKPASDHLSPIKQALLKLREMRAQVDEVKFRRQEPIAIVGVGLRFPGGCQDLDALWQLLVNGLDAISEVPRERWEIDAYYDPDPDTPGKMYARHGGFLDSIDQFDAAFFGISSREAKSMDPQQRLLLEVGWEALENAGQAPNGLSKSLTGIFVAINNSDYFRYLFSFPQHIDAYAITGNTFSIAASRLSYLLNLKGPALAVDTACSSSLVAVHLAVRSLRSGECDLALVGGVNLMLTPEITINFCKSRMLSANGKCRTFDAEADGYVRGEGCAMVALKRLSDAKSNGDRILAVIRGSAINQDGRTSGITAPNGPSQEVVICAALKDGGVNPADVGYIEAHGTATPLGDPIEMHALGNVFGQGRRVDRPLAIGSVKTNFGHLEAAAGIAGLIKTALVVQKGIIPPHLHLDRINPHIPLDQWPVTIPTKATPFPSYSATRIAGVSAFGLSGTNAHVILEAFGDAGQPGRSVTGSLQVLALSARNETALKQTAQRFHAHLSQEHSDSLEDICFTANAGRSHFNHRLSVVAETKDQASAQLSAFCDGGSAENMVKGSIEDGAPPAKVSFLFTGQGSQYEGMGRELYQTQLAFRKALDQCQEVLRPHLGQPLLSALYPEPGSPSVLNQSLYTQTALFALEYALVQLWRSWGVLPSVVMGHSLGEYAAACAAGVFSVEDGLKLIVERARLIESLQEHGEMAAVLADSDQVAPAIAPFAGKVSIAALNGPRNTVISGAGPAIREIIENFAARGVVCRPLNVAQAFHSPLLDPMLDRFEQAAGRIHFKTPKIGMISNLTGRFIDGDEILHPLYWRRHLREPVRFSDSIATLRQRGCRIFVEIGPHPVLSTMAQLIDGGEESCWLPSLNRQTGDWTQMIGTLAALYVRGVAVDWDGFYRDRPHRRCALPTYPFQRERYWLDFPGTTKGDSSQNPALAWRSVVEAGRRQSEQGPLGLQPESYIERWTCLERLTNAVTAQTLLKLGVYRQANESYSADEILDRCSVQPTYRHLLHRWLARLVDSGALRWEGANFINPRPFDLLPVRPQLESAREAFSDHPRFVEYIERCGNMLVEVLTGRQSALETLFPEGSPYFAEWLYGEFPVSRYISGIAASAVSALVSAQAGDAPLRILEIGAGTGGTTGEVLRSLPPRSAEYWFTDVSEFFLNRAKERFTEFSCLRYRMLDIEQPPHGQGFVPNSFHAVVATNALHATRNLDTTIDHVLHLLTSGGLLVLCEVTRELAWYDITTGLIEGWQRFEDRWRTDSPILSPERWLEVLESKGFEEVEVLPQKGSVAEVLGQHVIIARAPIKEPSMDMVWSGVAAQSPQASKENRASTECEALSISGFDQAARRVLDSPAEERHSSLVDFVLAQVALVLRMRSSHRPGRRSRLMDLGIDSLMAVELRNRLGKALGLPNSLPASLIYDYPTPESIALFLEQELIRGGVWGCTEGPQTSEIVKPTGRTAEEIAGLSDEQVEQMILERLKRKKEEADI